MQKKIVVIKHGALGDIIFSLGAFKALRDFHKEERVILLTSSPFIGLAKQSGYFDEVWTDDRPRLWSQPLECWKLFKKLSAEKIDRIYDLQRSKRTKWYFKILRMFSKPMPEWCGTVEGCAYHYKVNSLYDHHVLDNHKEQLSIAGIPKVGLPNLEWMKNDISHFNLPKKYFLLVPGCSPTQLHKRWPAKYYGNIARKLLKKGLIPVLIGTKDEAESVSLIQKMCPEAISLLGQTSLNDIVEIARHAQGALGHDTGPMHMIVFAQCPSLLLFSYSSGPELCGPRDGISKVIQKNNLEEMPLEKVWKNLQFRAP